MAHVRGDPSRAPSGSRTPTSPAIDPITLTASLPDVPRWAETRWLLRSGAGRLIVAGEGGVVLCDELRLGAVVGRPPADALRQALRETTEGLDVVVQLDALERFREAVPEWTISIAQLHQAPAPFAATGSEDDDTAVLEPPFGDVVDELPEDIRREAPLATAMVIRRVGGGVASVCCAVVVTETLWDVGIDTLAGHRRRGHATVCFRALAGYMAAEDRQPVWAAEEGNAASLGLARRLGFRPVDRLAVARRVS